MLDRRRFLSQGAAFCTSAAAASILAPWARASSPPLTSTPQSKFDLAVGRTRLAVDGKAAGATLVNNMFPGPLLRWREGDEVTINVANHLEEDTSIHWHGILLPAAMDGVPGVSFPGIGPHEQFQYRFKVKQSGTYWYHSHSGFQEQTGHYGPIIIDRLGREPAPYEREHVIMLGDWLYSDPSKLFQKLKKSSEALNFQKRTFGDFLAEAREDPRGAFSERAMWGSTRMSPTDIADVTGAAYAYLVNGHGPGDNWTGLFEPGERVRLRIINASAMSIFNLRVPGLEMSVVAADGLDVAPVSTDEIQIGVAETYDVIVRPADRAYTLFAETIDRSGFARATLAPRRGMTAEIPALRARPVLTMKDMAMGHDAHASKGPADSMIDHGSMGHGSMDHSSMGRGASNGSAEQSHNHPTGVGVDMIAVAPTNRLADRGIGLEDVSHRVLTYSQLESLDPNPDQRAPGREIELHLTGNMARYMWSFDGVKFSEVEEAIMLHQGERLRMTLVNDTMMNHPIHLHGMFFDVVTGDHGRKPRKHTIVVKPGEKLSFDVTADAPGEWAFHCHLMYHMAAGMMQTVNVRRMSHPGDGDHEPPAQEPESPHSDHGSHKRDQHAH